MSLGIGSSLLKGAFLCALLLILQVAGLVYVLFLEALRYNFFSWALFSLICQKVRLDRRKGLGSVVCPFLGVWKGAGNLGSSDVDSKLSDLRPFECVQCNCPGFQED